MKHKIGDLFKFSNGIYRIKEFVDNEYHIVEWVVNVTGKSAYVDRDEQYPNTDLDDDIKLSGNKLIKILYGVEL